MARRLGNLALIAFMALWWLVDFTTPAQAIPAIVVGTILGLSATSLTVAVVTAAAVDGV